MQKLGQVVDTPRNRDPGIALRIVVQHELRRIDLAWGLSHWPGVAGVDFLVVATLSHQSAEVKRGGACVLGRGAAHLLSEQRADGALDAGGEIGTAANVERGACAIGITAQELAQQRGIVTLQQQFVDPSPATWLQHKPGSRIVMGKTDCAVLA